MTQVKKLHRHSTLQFYVIEGSSIPLLHSTICTAPSVPRLLSVTRILSDGFELNWVLPREPNGRPQYEIEYGTDDTNFTTVDTGNRDTHYNLTGLLQNTTYYIRVLAVNYFTSDGVPLRGDESETVSGIIIPEPGEDAAWRVVACRKLTLQ